MEILLQFYDSHSIADSSYVLLFKIPENKYVVNFFLTRCYVKMATGVRLLFP
jgi:hypothetical protein